MKTIAFSLQKGGVGKTSLSVSTAVELAKNGRTIIIDCDPQGNASSWLLTTAPKWELASVLFGKATVQEAIVKTPTENLFLDILPTFGLGGELKVYGENQAANEPFIFCDLSEQLAALGYDFCILDLSPGMGRLERAALVSADEVITPMTPEEFSLDGIQIFTNELAKIIKAMKRGPTHKKIIVNSYNKTIAQHNDIVRRVQDELTAYDRYIIPVDPAFRKAQAEHVPIQELKKEHGAKTETIAELSRIGAEIWR